MEKKKKVRRIIILYKDRNPKEKKKERKKQNKTDTHTFLVNEVIQYQRQSQIRRYIIIFVSRTCVIRNKTKVMG